MNLATAARAFYRKIESELISEIETFVKLESPTSDPTACDTLASHIERRLAELGAELQLFNHAPRPVCGSFSDTPQVALVFHHDTVWPHGSFPNPRRTAHEWYAPGIFDMKANIPLLLWVLQFWREQDAQILEKVRFLSSPDEEIMGQQSRTHMPELAKDCEWALVFEPPKPDGSFKWQRKGLARLLVHFEGIATHAGNHYTSGVSALTIASRWLLAAEALSQPERGLTINVGLLRGGSAVNTRPGEAEAGVDVRFDRLDDWLEVKPKLEALGTGERFPPAITVDVEVPPMHADHAGWETLEKVCGQLALPYGRDKAGGASDGSNIATRGVKVLDGLGIPGAGEHATNEHIRIDRLEGTFIRNALLLAALLT